MIIVLVYHILNHSLLYLCPSSKVSNKNWKRVTRTGLIPSCPHSAVFLISMAFMLLPIPGFLHQTSLEWWSWVQCHHCQGSHYHNWGHSCQHQLQLVLTPTSPTHPYHQHLLSKNNLNQITHSHFCTTDIH